MIVIAGYIDVDPTKRDEFLAAAVALQDRVREEDGCGRYVFSADAAEPGRVQVSEEWASEDALEVHGGTPHFKAFNAGLGAFGVKGVELYRYDAEGKRSLFG